MKTKSFFAVLSAIIFLSSCSADFDNYREVSRGEIVKIYFMENNQPYIDIKVSADSVVEFPVISHKDYKGRYAEFRQGDEVILFQFMKNEKAGKYFLSAPEFSQKDFEEIVTDDSWANTICLCNILWMIAAFLLIVILFIRYILN